MPPPSSSTIGIILPPNDLFQCKLFLHYLSQAKPDHSLLVRLALLCENDVKLSTKYLQQAQQLSKVLYSTISRNAIRLIASRVLKGER